MKDRECESHILVKTLEVEHTVEQVRAERAVSPPVRGSFAKSFNIVRELAVADFRLKYHDSALGYIWSMLNPMFMFAIYYFVFTKILPSNIGDYPIFLLIGILGYTFFQDCTFSAMNAISGKSGLMKKIYFPRSIIVFASMLTCILSYAINTVVLLALVAILKGFSPFAMLLPIPIACLVLFSAGISFLLAALFAYFRDMVQIWNVLTLAIFWVSSIVFNVDRLPASISSIVYFNPLTRIFALMRHYLLYDYFDFRFLLMTILYSMAAFAIGFAIFQRYEKRLPELF